MCATTPAHLALVARSGSRLAQVARRCAARGAVAEVFPCDVTDESAVAAMASAVQRRFRRVDVLINNAGHFAGAALLDMSVAQFDALIATNPRNQKDAAQIRRNSTHSSRRICAASFWLRGPSCQR